VQGRLREPFGGGALALRGIRLMASGLPHPQWNNGDVTAADADLEGARAFYAERGVPWGVCVPRELPWSHGRHLFTKRLMGLEAPRFSPAPAVPGLAFRRAGPEDLDAVLRVDCAAFEAHAAQERRWIEPHLDAPGLETALAELDGEPVGTAYSLRSDGWAGPCLNVAGVAVLPAARGRGVGAAVSSWLLERSFAAGAELAHLHPDTDAAARLYGRLGFAEVPGFGIYADL
jgi:GNAT superfamily N-acetyltransferase